MKILRSPSARRSFSNGNGDKLIKRLLSILKGTRTPLPDDIFRWLLYEKPSLRKELFAAWAKSGVTKNQIDRMTEFLASGEAIDDMVYIHSMNAMAHTLFRRRFKNVQFSQLRDTLKGTEPALLYGRLLLVSRFESPSLLWSEIQNTIHIWSKHKFLSRQVAGFSPLIFGTAHWQEYEEIVRRWAGNEGMSVFEFHSGLRGAASWAKSVFPFLKAPNPTSGTEITHAKSLMILSVLQNATIPKITRAKIVGGHATMMSDIYYQRVFSDALTNMP